MDLGISKLFGVLFFVFLQKKSKNIADCRTVCFSHVFAKRKEMRTTAQFCRLYLSFYRKTSAISFLQKKSKKSVFTLDKF